MCSPYDHQNTNKQRSASEAEPVGQRGAVGDAHEASAEIGGIPVAGGAHGARHQGRGVGE